MKTRNRFGVLFAVSLFVGVVATQLHVADTAESSPSAQVAMNIDIITGDVVACPGDTVLLTFVTRMLGGFEGLQFRNIFVESSLCDSFTFVGGDTNGNGDLDFGEEFTNQCSAVVFLSQTHFAADAADVYLNGQMFGTVSGEDTSEVTVIDCDAGCTFTLGYWKNHLSDWPLENVTVGGETYSKSEAAEILSTEVVHDATYILMHQLIPAILNVVNGAAPDVIAETLLEADAWLTEYPLGSDPRGRERKTGISLARTLDDFNNGWIGPGHCDD